VLSEGDILTVTERGYGKRSKPQEHSCQGRGGQGVIGIQTSERNGQLIAALQVTNDDDIMLISDGGTLVRTHAEEISTLGRNTQGVTLIRLRDNENLVGVARIQCEDDEASDSDEIDTEISEVVDAVNVETEEPDGDADE